jgi:hypothetical protein
MGFSSMLIGSNADLRFIGTGTNDWRNLVFKNKKRMFIMLLVIAAVLAVVGSISTVASAGGMTKVENWWSGRAWYGATGSGIVHERYHCDENWNNCNNWTWFPVTKFQEPPECEGVGPYYWGYVPDVGDGSDILKPGEYWICIKDLDGEIFRDKTED